MKVTDMGNMRNLVLGLVLISHAVMVLPAERALISPALEPYPHALFNELNACVTGGTVMHRKSWAVRQLTSWYRAFSSPYFTDLPGSRNGAPLAQNPALLQEIRSHIMQMRQHVQRATEGALIATLDLEVRQRGRSEECGLLVGKTIIQLAMQRDFALAWADAIEVVIRMEPASKATTLQYQQLRVKEGLDQVSEERRNLEIYNKGAQEQSNVATPTDKNPPE